MQGYTRCTHSGTGGLTLIQAGYIAFQGYTYNIRDPRHCAGHALTSSEPIGGFVSDWHNGSTDRDQTGSPSLVWVRAN